MSNFLLTEEVSKNLPEIKAERAKLIKTYEELVLLLETEKLNEEKELKLQAKYNEFVKYAKDSNEELVGDFSIRNEPKKEEEKSKFHVDNIWVVGIIAAIIEVTNLTLRLKYPTQWPINSTVVVAFLPLVFLIAPYILPYFTMAKKIIQEDKESISSKVAEAQEMLDDLQYAVQLFDSGQFKQFAEKDEKFGENLKKIENLPIDVQDTIRKLLFANAQEILQKSLNNYDTMIMWHTSKTGEILTPQEGEKH